MSLWRLSPLPGIIQIFPRVVGFEVAAVRGMVVEAAVILTGEVGLLAGKVDEPGEAVVTPVVPVAVLAADVLVVGPDVPAVGVVPDVAVVGWLAIGGPGTEVDSPGVAVVPPALVDPPAGAVVPPVPEDPLAGAVVGPVPIDPPAGAVVPPALVDPPAGAVVPPVPIDPPVGAVVPPVPIDPPAGAVVPPALVDPPVGAVVAPALVDPLVGDVVPPVLAGPDSVVVIDVPSVGGAVVPDTGCVDAVGVVEDTGGIKPVSGGISLSRLISNLIFPFFSDAVP